MLLHMDAYVHTNYIPTGYVGWIIVSVSLEDEVYSFPTVFLLEYTHLKKKEVESARSTFQTVTKKPVAVSLPHVAWQLQSYV